MCQEQNCHLRYCLADLYIKGMFCKPLKNISQHLGHKLEPKTFCGPNHQSQSRGWVWSCECVVPLRRLRSAYGMWLSTYLHLFKHSPLSADSSRPGSVSASFDETQTTRASTCQAARLFVNNWLRYFTPHHTHEQQTDRETHATHNIAQHTAYVCCHTCDQCSLCSSRHIHFHAGLCQLVLVWCC